MSGPNDPIAPSVDSTPIPDAVPVLTYGDKLAGRGFNPSNNPVVDACKEAYAKIIDQLDLIRSESSNPEVKRMCSVAITEAQTSQMWAVKAITWTHL